MLGAGDGQEGDQNNGEGPEKHKKSPTLGPHPILWTEISVLALFKEQVEKRNRITGWEIKHSFIHCISSCMRYKNQRWSRRGMKKNKRYERIELNSSLKGWKWVFFWSGSIGDDWSASMRCPESIIRTLSRKGGNDSNSSIQSTLPSRQRLLSLFY